MEQTANTTNISEKQQFLNIFQKKGKILYRWHKRGLNKIADGISPSYRDFVNKVLSNSKLKIEREKDYGYCSPSYPCYESFKRRASCTIAIDFYDVHCFLHELSHSIDFLFGGSIPMSCTVIIQNGKTLRDIFDEEFKEHQEEIWKFVMNEYRFSIDPNIYKGAYDIFINNMPKYLSLCSTVSKKDRKKLHQELYECGFVEVYYQIATKKCFRVLQQKYLAILDALSSTYDITGLFLPGHEKEYYATRPEKGVLEFFANVCADKLTGNHTRYDQLIKLMPKSFNAFERLFVLIYDRIQNNKRFTDLKIIEMPEDDIDELNENESEDKESEVKA